ncbi:MAG: hypothetical protein ACOWWM_18195 [Desulfobacterales bacterium]
MKRKLIYIIVALVGFIFAFGSNSWADRGRDGHRKDIGRNHHQISKTLPGHHNGWVKGRGNPHRPAYSHRRPPVVRHYHHYRPVVVEKHVHHYHGRDRRHDGHYSVAASIIDHAFGISVGVSGRR